ncbi:MAG: T9SS type A sorting domain-containing protein [Ignavibacteriae bacterium]|nr:T9SS type A sorting domain-containing protein [Ignavibacteriota bacterium]
MKKTITFLLLLLFSNIYPQLLVEEFNYTVGEKLSDNGWVAYSGETGTPIYIVSGNLEYPDYVSSNIGNSIEIIGQVSTSEDVKKTFTAQTSGSVYFSFLVNFNSVTNAIDGEYFVGIVNSTSGTMKGRLFIKRDTSNFAFGISKAGTNLSETEYTPFSYSTNTTYLLVLKYTINSGSSNDVIELFINPDLSGSEPSADLVTSDNATDLSEVGGIALRQGNSSFDVILDGLRIATSWGQAPLPVELTSFTATANESTVELQWQTATEMNNYGFEIERKNAFSAETAVSSLNSNWKKIDFINGHGNSNSPKNYFYKDISSLNSGKYWYRLKQIDIDGKFEYSKEIEVNIEIPKIFSLEQNYPNPFNPITMIKFTIPENNLVRPQKAVIDVYNVLGQKISTLVNEEKLPGIYKIEFDGSKYTSGIYFYKLTVGKFSQIKKMILTK